MYHEGLGVIKDDQTAIKWLTKAKKHNDRQAAEILKQINNQKSIFLCLFMLMQIKTQKRLA